MQNLRNTDRTCFRRGGSDRLYCSDCRRRNGSGCRYKRRRTGVQRERSSGAAGFHRDDPCHRTEWRKRLWPEAGCGAAKFLEEKGVGFETGYAKVPLICQSCIYDLGIGRADVRPDLQMGYLACQDAYERDQRTAMGNVGAGTGATVGKAMGAERMMKSGLGSYALQAGELKVGALVVVNALGDIYDSKTHEKIAGMRNGKGDGFEDGEQALLSGIAQQEGDNLFTANTTIGIVICNADLNKMQLKRVASASHNGYARTIRPVHTSADGDSIYAAAVGSSRINANVDMVSLLAVRAMENAVNRAVLSAKSLHGVPAAEDILQRIK